MFPCGVASGDVTATSVVLWTLAEPPPGAEQLVDWRIVEVDSDRCVQQGSTALDPAGSIPIQIDVDGLEPATHYEYRFSVADTVAIGRTRTLPEQADEFRFAVVCCSRWGWPGFERYAAVADERPDVVLHLGDAIYEVGETPPSGVRTDPPDDCHTLDDYRRRYRQHRSHPAMRQFHAAVPVISVWDDHEVVDDAPDPAQADRRRAGQQAWREWTPMRQDRDDASIDRFLTIDGLVDLALVDSRFSGRLPSDVDGPGSVGDGRGHLLAPDQWRALEDFVRSTDAPWLVFANQVQVGPTTLTPRPAFAWPPWRRVVNPDQWDGFPDDRDRLFHLLDERPAGRVLLSGDLHSAWSRALSYRDRPIGHEFTSPSISGTTFAGAVRGKVPIPTGPLTAWLRLINPGIEWLELDRHGFTVCDVTPDRFTATFVMHDGDRHEISLPAR